MLFLAGLYITLTTNNIFKISTFHIFISFYIIFVRPILTISLDTQNIYAYNCTGIDMESTAC